MIHGVLSCGDFENQIRPPGVVETGWQRGPSTAPRSLERYRDQSDLPMLPNPAPGLIVQADRWVGISIDEANVLHSAARVLHFSAVITAIPSV